LTPAAWAFWLVYLAALWLLLRRAERPAVLLLKLMFLNVLAITTTAAFFGVTAGLWAQLLFRAGVIAAALGKNPEKPSKTGGLTSLLE
jgi:hypothetical protein